MDARTFFTGFGVALAVGLGLGGCGSTGATLADERVVADGGATLGAADLVGAGRLAVLVFWSQHCPCQKAHDARLEALAERWKDKGVAVYGIASEPGLDAAGLAAERAARGYGFPLLLDGGGAFASAAGATFATHTVIIDATGEILYSGGIDSDSVKLHDDAKPYLEDALTALTGGKPSPTGGEPRGCVLRKAL